MHVPELNITHRIVNHSVGFLNPEIPDVHTQNIEGFWSVLKRCLRRKGTNFKGSIEEYFGEILYRKKYGNSCFSSFIEHISLFFLIKLMKISLIL